MSTESLNNPKKINYPKAKDLDKIKTVFIWYRLFFNNSEKPIEKYKCEKANFFCLFFKQIISMQVIDIIKEKLSTAVHTKPRFKGD